MKGTPSFYLIPYVVFLLLSACQKPDEGNRKAFNNTQAYFDVAGFVQQQVTLLESERATAVKTVLENGQHTESKTLTALNWRKELESFAELDINKPAFRNSYSQTQQDSAGFITQTYTLKPEADGDVKWLLVTKDLQQQVTKIAALHQNKNVLINTRQQMQLTCDTKSGKARVKSYRIQGSQNPIIFDSLQYVIFTQIR